MARKKTIKSETTQPEATADAAVPAPETQSAERPNGSWGLNRVMLIGNLGHDPELRHTQGGTPVTSFRIATTFGFRDSSGSLQKRTEWHRIVAWNRLAEVSTQYLGKGRQVYVEGRLQTREFTDPQSGERRFTTEVVAQRLQMLGGRPERLGAQDDEAEAGEDIPF